MTLPAVYGIFLKKETVMNLNEFKSLDLSRQSCRCFSDKEIAVNDLRRPLVTASRAKYIELPIAKR